MPLKRVARLRGRHGALAAFWPQATTRCCRVLGATAAQATTLRSRPPRQALTRDARLPRRRAVHIQTEEGADVQPLAVAKLLRAVAERDGGVDMMVLGKQAIDDDSNQTGQMVAGLMQWPQATFASEVAVAADGRSVEVTREVDGGLETLRMPLPAVVTTDLRLNEPRYATLPNIMKAKKKPVETLTPGDLGVCVEPKLRVVEVAEPEARKGGSLVQDVDELLDKLRNTAKVL